MTYIKQFYRAIERFLTGVLSVSALLITLRTLKVDILSTQSYSTMANRQYAITAT